MIKLKLRYLLDQLVKAFRRIEFLELIAATSRQRRG